MSFLKLKLIESHPRGRLRGYPRIFAGTGVCPPYFCGDRAPDLVFVKNSVLMLFTEKAALSTEGTRNEHFNASKVAEG